MKATDNPAAEQRWQDAPLAELVDHIVYTFHGPLRLELQRLESLARDLHTSAGGETTDEILTTFLGLRSELEDHMMKEEQILFPMIRQGDGFMADGPIQVMEAEHDNATAALGRLRELADGYRLPEEGGDDTRASLWRGLAALEEVMREHIHLENDILFPRALAG